MKTEDFSESIAASDLIVGMSKHLIEYMKVCGIDGQGHCTYKNSNRIFSEDTLLI